MSYSKTIHSVSKETWWLSLNRSAGRAVLWTALCGNGKGSHFLTQFPSVNNFVDYFLAQAAKPGIRRLKIFEWKIYQRPPPSTRSNRGNNCKLEDRALKHVDEREWKNEKEEHLWELSWNKPTHGFWNPQTAEEGQQVKTFSSRERYSQTATISNRFSSIWVWCQKKKKMTSLASSSKVQLTFLWIKSYASWK